MMMIFWVLVFGAIAWAVVYAARNTRRPSVIMPDRESPFDVLKRRYAAGEINREQFEEMKHNLEVQGGS